MKLSLSRVEGILEEIESLKKDEQEILASLMAIRHPETADVLLGVLWSEMLHTRELQLG
jgi:hypothetical protein